MHDACNTSRHLLGRCETGFPGSLAPPPVWNPATGTLSTAGCDPCSNNQLDAFGFLTTNAPIDRLEIRLLGINGDGIAVAVGATVPLPAAVWLLGSGLLGLVGLRRRRRAI